MALIFYWPSTSFAERPVSLKLILVCTTSQDRAIAKFSPNGEYFGIIDNGLLTLYDTTQWNKTSIQLDTAIHDFSFTADRRSLVIQDEKQLSFLDLPTLSLKRQILYDPSSFDEQFQLLPQNDSLIYVTCGSRTMPKVRKKTDWRILLASDSVQVRDLIAGTVVSTISDPDGKIVYFKTDLNCSRFATLAYQENKVKLWKLPGGVIEKEVSGWLETFAAPLLSRKGRFFGYLNLSRDPSIWDMNSGCEIISLERHDKSVVRTIPDEGIELLLTPCAITIFEIATHQAIDQIVYSWDDANFRDASPDGRFISISARKKVSIYSVDPEKK
ncbi:hypothetical protein JNM05_15060 [bacterium]|nr:hypothetical protein [bacterium]